MSAALIAQLIIALGPPALQTIADLVKVWNKPTLTEKEVTDICDKSKKAYDDYINEAKANSQAIANPIV